MQAKTQAETFMRGAFLITLAQFVTKILGAIHRPISQSLIGDAGLGLATPPSSAYYIMLAISSIGLNVAISRLVAERLALQDLRGARRVFQVATWMLVVSGLVFSLLFALGSGWMAWFVGIPEAQPGFLVLAPALFFVALLCVFRGLYQGRQQMGPSAVSQVVEQVVRVTFSLGLMVVLSRISVVHGATAFNAGNTVGIFTAVLYFGWVYWREKPTSGWTTVAPGVVSYENESATRLMGKILAIAAPLSLIGAVAPLMGLLDSAIVTRQLVGVLVPQLAQQGIEAATAAQMAADRAKEAVAWLANAGTLRDLPTILTTALYVSLVPAIAESYATGKLEQARYRAATAFRITLLIALPATMGLLAGSREVYSILYGGSGWAVMAPLAWSTLFMMIQQTSSGTLQGMGLVWLSVRNLMAGMVLKVLLTYGWTAIPALGVQGAAYATSAGYVLAAALNLWALRRHLGLGLSLRADIARPALASLLMGAVVWVSAPLAHRLLAADRLAGVIVVSVGALVYGVALLALGGVTTADLGLIPGVTPGMIDWLRRYRLLRD